MAPSYPLINGVRHDWSSVEINLEGTVYLGCKELKYSHSLEPGEVEGTHAQLLGRTRGKYRAEGSIVFYKEEAADLQAKFGDGYLEKVFSITVSYTENGKTITDKLFGVRLKKEEGGGSSGGDPLEESYDLHIMALVKNGKKPLSNMLGV